MGLEQGNNSIYLFSREDRGQTTPFPTDLSTRSGAQATELLGGGATGT